MNDSRQILYKPSWQFYSRSFLVGLLLLPVFGIGLIWIAILLRRIQSVFFSVTDSALHLYSYTYTEIPLASISAVALSDVRMFRGQSYGTIEVECDDGAKHSLPPISNPSILVSALQNVISANQIRQQHIVERENFTVKSYPGTLERMNDLVGLWQQGLISDEDYQRECVRYQKNDKR